MMRGFFNFGSLDRLGSYGGYSMMGGYWWIGGIIHVVIWIAVIWLIVWAVKRFTRKQSSFQESNDAALKIARERFAKGEISKEQFDEIKQGLQ